MSAHRTSRVLLSLLLPLAGWLAVATPAQAESLARVHTEQKAFDCQDSTAAVHLYVSVETFGSEPPEVSPYLEVWDGDALVLNSGDHASDYSLTDSALSVTMPLLDGNGEPAGDGTVRLRYQPVGEAHVVETPRKQSGNYWEVITDTFQDLSVDGAVLDVPGRSVQLDCSAVWATTLYVFNRAASNVAHNRYYETTQGCTSDQIAGFYVSDTPEGPIVALFVPHESTMLMGESLIKLANGRGTTGVDLLDPDTGQVVDRATVGVTIGASVGEPTGVELHNTNGSFIRTAQWHQLGVSVTFASGERTSLDCQVLAVQVDAKSNPAEGPKPGGVAPANDAPGAATALQPGQVVRQSTRGTVADAEAPMTCYPDEPALPLGHTVWYAATGSGGTLRLDTAGSDIDTLVAVYERTDAGLRLVTCGREPGEEDAVSWQDYAEWTAQPGVQYLIQVGGLEGEYGAVKVSLTRPSVG
jgi:hypothetical protein